MKILIVDDHPVLRDGVEALLRRNDAALAVVQAASADDAMQMLDQHADIDAIVLDLKMRGTSGVDAIAACCRRPRIRATCARRSRTVRSATCRSRRARIRCCPPS